MFLRYHRVGRGRKKQTYWALVRSVRRGGRIKQETVAYLGALTTSERRKAAKLGRRFVDPKSETGSLFESEVEIDVAQVRLRSIETERSRSFGGVWLGLKLWQALRLDRFCEHALPQGREAIPWAELASVLVIARFCEPSSELHIAEVWLRKTALGDLLGIDESSIHHTRLYHGLDRLLEHKRQLEDHLRERFETLFDVEYDILLYDVTSTNFEGKAEANPQAQRGHSRDHRPDCKQVCIGLVVTRDGYPLAYEVFDGNRSDVTTVKEIVTTMESRFGRSSRIWVMDRGMSSDSNLEWMKKSGRKYVIGAPKSELKKWRAALEDESGWETIRDGLQVKLCESPEGVETFVLCRSSDRRHKEAAIHDRAAGRITDACNQLARRLTSAKRKASRDQVERQVGRILAKSSRAGGKFRIEVLDDDCPAGLRLNLIEDPEWHAWANLSEGAYVLRSNVSDWTPDDLWRTYVQLSHAEAAFRIQKSELKVRPIWHQHEHRVQAHILVCFLAYAMWKTLEGWSKEAGLGSSPRKVLDEIARIQSLDVIVPIVDGPKMTIRCVVRPDPEQAVLVDRLGLTIPKRLRDPLPQSVCSG